MKNKAQDMMEKGKDAAHEGIEKAKEGATSVIDKVRDTASNIASGAASTAGNVASFIGDKAEGAVEAAGSGMKSLGETLREKGPHSGVLGGATSGVASALENTGAYLEHGIGSMCRDVAGVIQRYPIAALCVGVTMGYMLARALRS
jgi:hypothetical protein